MDQLVAFDFDLLGLIGNISNTVDQVAVTGIGQRRHPLPCVHSIFEFRAELTSKMDAGTLDPADAYRQAVAVDPHDPVALRFLALKAEEQSNPVLAAELGRRFVQANPVSHEGYLLLGRVLSDAALARAYAALGKEKLHFNPEAQSELAGDEVAEEAAEAEAAVET